MVHRKKQEGQTMTQFYQEPRNWRDVALVEHANGVDCVDLNGYDESNAPYECAGFDCDVCVLSNDNPNRAAYIQSCKDRLAEEKKMEEKKLYDLTKVGPVLSLTPVVIFVGESNREARLISIFYSSLGSGYTYGVIYADESYGRVSNVRHEIAPPVPKTVPMTAYEIAMLPRGTAFIYDFRGEHRPYYNLVICENQNCFYGVPTGVGGVPFDKMVGYRLSGSTEIMPFTKVVV
jgi:hypothetical protein